MSKETTRGLSLKEQALFLCALCRYSDNPESCPLNLMTDIEECPFDSDCENTPWWGWLGILKNREIGDLEEQRHE